MAPLGSAPIPWLKPLSWLYGLGAWGKNACYQVGLCKPRKLPVPVVSIGNLSAGGTGKTPMVAWLLEHYREAGLRVGVLARGYGRKEGERLNDEGRLLAARFKNLPQEQSPDRYAAGLQLLGEQDLDLILLDDGFQHRKLHRDLDVCLLDAADPFRGGLLPSGWLRESPSSLQRADLIIATGAQALTEDEKRRFADRLPSCTVDKACFLAETRARDLVSLPSGDLLSLDSLRGARVFLLAGIARPERFLATASALGADVVGHHWLPDHGAFSPAELVSWADKAGAMDATLVMTEKDAARCSLGPTDGPDRQVLRIDLHFPEAPPLGLLVPFGIEER